MEEVSITVDGLTIRGSYRVNRDMLTVTCWDLGEREATMKLNGLPPATAARLLLGEIQHAVSKAK